MDLSKSRFNSAGYFVIFNDMSALISRKNASHRPSQIFLQKKSSKSLSVQNKAIPLHPVSETIKIPAVIAQLVEQRIRNA